MDESLARGELSLRQLAHFVAVAEDGTISGAAERLIMSSSALSASITELERTLGADLLVRRRAQGVSLTPMGQLVLDRARRLLSDGAELTYLVRGNGTDLVGPLVVGCFVTLAPTVLPRLLADFEELHPRVTLDFVEGHQDQLREALLAGEIDAAVLYDMGPLEDLDRIVLYVARGYALFGQAHPLAARETVTLEELAGEPLHPVRPAAEHGLRDGVLPGARPGPERPAPYPLPRADQVDRRPRPVLRHPRAASAEQAQLRGPADPGEGGRAAAAGLPRHPRLAARPTALTPGPRSHPTGPPPLPRRLARLP